MSPGASVVTTSSPAANAVNLLVETVILNYMALHQEEGNFDQPAFFPRHGLGGTAARDALTIFAPVCNGTIKQPGLTASLASQKTNSRERSGSRCRVLPTLPCLFAGPM